MRSQTTVEPLPALGRAGIGLITLAAFAALALSG
ncbi:MAG: hypothetical protein RIQ66_502, partial [Pseudomonadota bacterium]